VDNCNKNQTLFLEMLTWLYNNDMNKTIIMFFTIVFGLAGSYLPMLFGNYDIFSVWSILGGLVFGFFGIWFGVMASKRFA